VLALQTTHPAHPRIAEAFTWPPGPRVNENVSQSYPTFLFNQLVDCCLTDINLIVSKMLEFKRIIRTTPCFVDNDGVRPMWRGVAVEKSRSSLTLEETERIAFATAYNMYPDWPLRMSLEVATRTLSYRDAMTKCDVTRAEERTRRVIISSRFGTEEKPMTVGQLAYCSHFAFSGNTIYPFFLFVQLNTGWNLESIMALTDCLDDHIEQDLMDEHYRIIYSSKQRTQKTVSHRSNIKSPNSVYRILRFIEAQVTQHRDSPHYTSGKLWQFVLAKNLWPKYERLMTNIDVTNIPPLSLNFLKRHNIDTGLNNKYPAIEARRLRTTYQTKRREQGLSTEAMADLMGHTDIDTTAKHYDNDVGSIELKNKQLRNLQDAYVEDFSNYRVRLAQNITLKQLREAVTSSGSFGKTTVHKLAATRSADATTAEIIHLLSPNGQTYIAACTNSLEPTWAGALKHLSQGESCTFFNRCCLCDKAVIFKESLPWVARRISDIEQLRMTISAAEWAANYGQELAGWQWILNNWSNAEDVAEARKVSSSKEFTLPLTMIGR
jgi:hypothetical protein